MEQFVSRMMEQMKEKAPLVHCITNYVTMNDCANVLLACGGSPIMADDPNEVEEITSLCGSLVLNLGMLSERRLEAMILAGKKANELGHPVILDPVGAGASLFRKKSVERLLKEVRFAVIKGNMSEMKTLFSGSGSEKGVDANEEDQIKKENLHMILDFSRKLSGQTGAVIVVTGAIDVVASENEAYYIENGHPMMARITGSGCMLAALLGAFAAQEPKQRVKAAATAVLLEGICGEKAGECVEKEKKGTGSFRTYLIDEVSKITGEQIRKYMKIREA